MSTKQQRILAAAGAAVMALVCVAIGCWTKRDTGFEPAVTVTTTPTTPGITPDRPSTTITGTTTTSRNVLTVTKPAQTTTAATKGVTVGQTAATLATETIPREEIRIGSETAKTEPYACESDQHHCDGPETHAYIQNLELMGCSYCGSHSCPSFYAVDEWGHTCYTPSECPQYDEQKDAGKYCPVCGRKNGNGNNGTCQKWMNKTRCLTCGETVDAQTCHSHE